MSKFISVGFLVGASTLISPSLEAVTLKKKNVKTLQPSWAKETHTRLPSPECIEVTRPLCPLLTVSITYSSQGGWLVAVQGAEKTAATSKASSVVSTRWRLPPLSPTQRQLPCQLMQMGKWLPGRGTCIQHKVKAQPRASVLRTFFNFLPATLSYIASV